MSATLLVATADYQLTAVYQQQLSACGYHVETAGSGLECLTQLCRRRPGLLVLDEDLLWGGGAGVLARMRDNDGIPSAPVVLLTNDDFDKLPVELLVVPIAHCL